MSKYVRIVIAEWHAGRRDTPRIVILIIINKPRREELDLWFGFGFIEPTSLPPEAKPSRRNGE